MPLTRPLSAIGEELWQILTELDQHLDEQARIRMASHMPSGTTSRVRFEPSRIVQFVQAHLQSTAGGAGGAVYDPAAFVTSTVVDCQATRVQDLTITRNGVNTYYLFLVPLVYDPIDNSYAKLDGVSGQPDGIFPLYLGV